MYATRYRRHRSYLKRQREDSILRKPVGSHKVYNEKDEKCLRSLCKGYGLLEIDEEVDLEQGSGALPDGETLLLDGSVICLSFEDTGEERDTFEVSNGTWRYLCHIAVFVRSGNGFSGVIGQENGVKSVLVQVGEAIEVGLKNVPFVMTAMNG